MTVNNNIRIPTKSELLKSANKFTRKRLWKLWLLTRVMVSANSRGYGGLCHRYLRWVDDFVDNVEIETNRKRDFVESQKLLLMKIINRENFTINFVEEFDLYYLVEFALENKRKIIINEVANTLQGLLNDVGRIENGGIFTEKELKKIITLQSESFCKMVNHFLLPQYDFESDPIFNGAFFWHVLLIRDFVEDANAGFINISREDIEKFNLNTNDLISDEKKSIWLKYKFPFILSLLEKEKKVLSTLPLKIKLFWVPGYFLILFELIRVKEYGYRFGTNIKKNGLKEIITFAKTTRLYLKFCFGVFVKQ